MSAVTERIERAMNPLSDHEALVQARRENVRLNTALAEMTAERDRLILAWQAAADRADQNIRAALRRYRQTVSG